MAKASDIEKPRTSNNVCAIIVTYRSGTELLECLEPIEDQVAQVVIVDNSSDTETNALLKDLQQQRPGLIVFYNPKNVGLAAALNTGIRYALEQSFPHILCLDHDSRAEPDMVARLLDAYSALAEQGIKKVGIVAANPFDTNIGKWLLPGLQQQAQNIVEAEKPIMSGSMINAEVFAEVGLFDESLFLYFVDNDFCLRCAEKGWKIFICRDAVLHHREGHKQIRRVLWKRVIYRNYGFSARYYIARSSVYMFRKCLRHRRYRYCCRLVGRMFSDFLRVLLMGKPKAKLLAFTFKGLFDAVKGRSGPLETPDTIQGLERK